MLISEAARLFGNKGYENTSMRDIAAAVGILPGSLYHHFPSKEELFTAVYSFAVAQSLDAVKMAQTGRVDPWARLEAVCIAHMQGLLDKNRFAAVLVSHPLADRLPEEVITLRDRYEAVFKDLIAELPLPAKSRNDDQTTRARPVSAIPTSSDGASAPPKSATQGRQNWTPIGAELQADLHRSEAPLLLSCPA